MRRRCSPRRLWSPGAGAGAGGHGKRAHQREDPSRAAPQPHAEGRASSRHRLFRWQAERILRRTGRCAQDRRGQTAAGAAGSTGTLGRQAFAAQNRSFEGRQQAPHFQMSLWAQWPRPPLRPDYGVACSSPSDWPGPCAQTSLWPPTPSAAPAGTGNTPAFGPVVQVCLRNSPPRSPRTRHCGPSLLAGASL